MGHIAAGSGTAIDCSATLTGAPSTCFDSFAIACMAASKA